MPRKDQPGLPDGCGFWPSTAGFLAVLGATGMTIAVTEYHPPWPSAWFIAGAVLCALGAVAAIWAVVLYMAHREAGRRWYRTRTLTLRKLNGEDLPPARREQRFPAPRRS